MTTKSGKHTNKIAKNTLSSAANNGVIKAVDMRKVAALSAGAAGVIAGAAIAFGATPAMAAETTSTPVKTSNAANEQDLTANKKNAEGEAKAEGASADGEAKADGAKETEDSASKKAEASDKADSKANKNETELAGENAAKVETKAADVVNQQAESGNTPAGSTTSDAEGSASADTNEQGAVNKDSGSAKRRGRRSLPGAQPTDEAATAQDREATGQQDPGPQANSEITISKDTKDTLPNMYAWGKSDNVYVESGQNQEVKFILKPADGVSVTKVAIFPNDNIDINNKNAKGFSEYNSGDGEWHQSYSGEYSLKTNGDGSVTLTMTKLYRKGSINGAQGYAANRSIYAYGVKDGKEVLLYKTNIARAATLIPPKKTGSIVLKYDEQLTDEQIRARLKQALDAPTEAKDGKSVREQIKDASQAHGVGVRKEESKPVVNTTDNPEKKIVITDKQAYDVNQFNRINKKTSADGAAVTTYQTGVVNFKTYLVSDLGYKSEAIALTVARYDTRIDKPVVEDPTNVSQEVQNEIAKKLANLNHIAQDKVTINADGTVTINFEGVDPSLAPTLNLSDLVLKKFEEKDVIVPTGDKAVFVANPLDYSKDEIARIKKAIYEANKGNDKLGLTEADYENQISLEYLKGNFTKAGHANQGISNGQAENTITVKIKTDKAVAEFTSNVKENKLTRIPNIRTDYDVTWKSDKIDGRSSDEGLSWSEDKKTIIYRYDPTAAQEFDTNKILNLLTAKPKEDKSGLPTLTGGEVLAHEGDKDNPQKSHVGYVLKDGQPTTELSLGNMDGAYWKYSRKVDNSGEKLGDNLSEAGSYSWDEDAKPVKVAAKKGKVYKARLFVLPYGMTMYRNIYIESGKNPWNTAKAINVIFVPQTNHKTKDLSKSIDEHKLADDKKTPTDSKYYNASADKKKAYDDALSKAKTLLDSVNGKQEKDLTEEQKAQIDNATINLNKAREELDGADTNKDKLNASIEANGKAAEGTNPASGTQATNQFKNVSDPDFKKADGSTDTDRNNAAKEAKKAYDDALAEANKVKEDKNATQKDVDAAKAKLDAAREKLNDFTTNKDELNNAIAQHGKVNTGDAKKTDPTEKLKTADPTYQNSTPGERKAYDDAVAEADKVSKDPNASQKEVNEAIKKLKDAKDALDKNATDKSPLDAAVQKSLDNPDPKDPNKHSVFYTNAAAKKDTDAAAKKAVEDYDKALAEAKRVLGDKNATKADVDKAKKDLEDAEKVLYAETYQTKATDLAEAIADNVSGYLMPAYFNAFDKAQTNDEQAKTDFKAYNDAYHAAKDLLKDIKKPNSTVTQDQANKVKDQLIKARKAIDKYATDTSRLSAAVFNDIAIKNSPAYKNLKALAEKTNPSEAEKADVEAAKKAKEAYDKAAEKLHNAITNKLPKDQADGKDIPDSNIPKKDGDLNDKDYLKDIQAHKNGEPLNRDVDAIIKEMNDAAKALDKFATKTDELLKSVNEHDNTQQTPAYKNASHPDYKQADGTTADKTKNDAAKKAVDEYGEALNKAKDLLKDPNATQAQINEAKKNLDDKRKALKDYDTNVDKLKSSVDKNGKEKHGDTAATEGTVTSDAYRNASDPHFMKEEGGKLVPDKDKNDQAAAAKKAYDEALTKAQELLKKHDDKDTPQDAKPTQKDVNDALKNLDEARKKLEDTYKTNTDALSAEAAKSTAEGATAQGADFENSPEFKNADAKKGEKGAENPDVKAYKDALKKARELVKAASDNTLSKHPTQQQVDEALDALKKAKQTITDGYKTNVTALNDAKKFANGGFKDTPEYKNAKALKDDQSAAADKKNAAQKAVNALDESVDDSAMKKAKAVLDKFDENGKPKQGETSIPTQKEVDAALDTLQKAMKTITDGYKTNADKLKYEVGDKDEQGKDVTPPFEASVAYKNALEKANAGDNDATAKLKDYADKLKAAQDLINKVNNPDQNAKPEDRPTQKQVDDALDALKKAKQAIDENFKTNAKDLKDEAAKSTDDTTDPAAQPTDGSFESTTEYQNALAKKTDEGKDNADVTSYKEALKKARTLLNKFDKDGKPKSDAKDVPSQKEVDEALQKLKDIKDKITKNYVTSPHDLYKEVDLSKDGNDDDRDDVFENTPAFKNATAKGDEAAKEALDDYNKKLKAAKDLLDKFDRTTGKPKAGATGVPTQKQLDDALKALQDAKKKIEDDYNTIKSELSREHSEYSSFENSPEFINAIAYMKDDISGYSAKSAIGDYKKALEDAKKVLDDPNATQDQVDEALRKLKEAKDAITRKYGTDKDKLKDEHDADSDFADSPEFQNADGTPEADAYKKALDEAKKVLNDPNATQAQVDVALKKLREAKDALVNKYKTDKDALQSEADDDPNFRNNTEYLIAGSPEFDAYKKALEDAKKVLSDPNATQAQVDAALKKLRDAKQRIIDKLKDLGIDINFGNGNGFGNGLNGYVPNAAGREGNGYVNNANANAVDKSALQAEVNSALDVRGNSDAAQAYKNALADAKRVLADANASQADVDAALQRLRDAKAGLLNESNVADHNLAKTGASTGLFAGLAAIFAGFGVAGVASRRRKHSND